VSWLIPPRELTPEQLRAVQLDTGSHKVVVGAPGSGKTQILLHRARHIIDSERVPVERVHVFVFTKVLRSYIRSALVDLHLPEESVSTLDAWCGEYHGRHIGRVPTETGGRMPDFRKTREAVAAALKGLPPYLKPLDVALVDEGQDLDAQAIDLLTFAARHVTVCMDRKQRVYDAGSDEMEVASRLGVRRRSVMLLDALRCSPFVTQLAAAFVEDSAEAEQWRNQVRTGHGLRETPLLYVAPTFDDEKRRLAEVLQTRLENNERVGVLFPTNRQVHGFAEGLRAAGFEVETQDHLDFASDRPKLITYHSAKGLTFDSVLLPRLVPGSFRSKTPDAIQRLIFVAVTRASKWVYMSTDSTFFMPLRALPELSAQGAFKIEGQIATQALY
jgi:superfamily I DNA/RNA helicase